MKFEYRPVKICDFQVSRSESADNPAKQTKVEVKINGEILQPTQRFWRSLFARLGLNEQVFRYFTHDEVFARVVESGQNESLQLCIERGDRGLPRLLAVTPPKRPVMHYEQARHIVDKHAGESPSYHDGVLTSRHVPRSGWNGFSIGPDLFHNRFVMETPVDGFGQPRIYLSLLRQICSNGAIGYSRSFRSDLRLGEDAEFTLERAMNQFDHEEGFSALRQRFESAQSSWASVAEVRDLDKVIARTGYDNLGKNANAGERLRKISGDLNSVYGMSNLESLSQKRQRILPANCRVYDLLNFASELASHHALPEAQPRLHAYIGTLVSDEYDLEGTAQKVPEFRDLFLNRN